MSRNSGSKSEMSPVGQLKISKKTKEMNPVDSGGEWGRLHRLGHCG